MVHPLPEPEQRMNCVYRLDKNLDWLSVVKIRYDISEFSLEQMAAMAEIEAKIAFPECVSIYVTEALEQTLNRCAACDSPCGEKNKPRTIHRNIRVPSVYNS